MAAIQEALIYGMILAAGADRKLSDKELRQMAETTAFLPVFAGFGLDQLPAAAARCAELLQEANGMELVLKDIQEALPKRLRATAYALACEVAIVDGVPSPEQRRMLRILRDRLDLDRLTSAAIERTIIARYARP